MKNRQRTITRTIITTNKEQPQTKSNHKKKMNNTHITITRIRIRADEEQSQ